MATSSFSVNVAASLSSKYLIFFVNEISFESCSIFLFYNVMFSSTNALKACYIIFNWLGTSDVKLEDAIDEFCFNNYWSEWTAFSYVCCLSIIYCE